MSIRVFLADDHTIVREGVACLLSAEKDITVVGAADNGRDAVAQVTQLRPDLVLCDVAMPQLNGVETTRQIVEFDACIKVLALSQQSDPHPVGRMIRAGASGYVLKGADFSELLDAIAAVMRGDSYLSPAVASGLVREYIRRSPASDGNGQEPPLLTLREREVLQMVAEGYRTREIADALGVSVKTIETHRKGMMSKLGLNSIAELTKYAVRTGITSLEN